MKPLEERSRRSPIPRRQLLTQTAREWRDQLAGCGRLRLDLVIGGQFLAIHELHATGAGCRIAAGSGHVAEPGLLPQFWMLLVTGGICHSYRMRALIGLHTLGRRLERARNARNAAITDELADQAAAEMPEQIPGACVSVPAIGGHRRSPHLRRLFVAISRLLLRSPRKSPVTAPTAASHGRRISLRLPRKSPVTAPAPI